MAEYIEREAAREAMLPLTNGNPVLWSNIKRAISAITAADVVPVVRCGECKHFNNDDGDCRCVKDAEWDEETATWYGFVSYHMPDFFCADGERKDGDGDAEIH